MVPMKGDARLSPQRSRGCTGQTVAAAGPFPAKSPPQLSQHLPGCFEVPPCQKRGFSAVETLRYVPECPGPLLSRGSPTFWCFIFPHQTQIPLAQLQNPQDAQELEPGGCDPPPGGQARRRLPEQPVAESQGNPLALKRMAGLALEVFGDFTCCRDPEPLGACGQGFFCSRDSFGGCLR